MGEYVRLMTNVCSWKAPAVLVHGFGRGGEGDTTCLYEDEHVRVWALVRMCGRSTVLAIKGLVTAAEEIASESDALMVAQVS